MQVVDDKARRRELGEFLRSRRQRLTPEAAGIQWGRRRRTPGLRREDVAELAGLGVAWYTWLEQARDISPSPDALRRIARALQLDPAEERYFLELALECTPVDCIPEDRPEETVPVPLQHLLEAVKGPAYIKGRRWDLLAFNRVCDAAFDYGSTPDRNILRAFFRAESRLTLPDWAHIARQHVAMFRSDCAGMMKDPWVRSLVEELTAKSEEFRTWWSEHEIGEMKSGPCLYDHPLVGRLTMSFTILQSADSPNLRLVAFLPEDEESRERIAQLVERKRAMH